MVTHCGAKRQMSAPAVEGALKSMLAINWTPAPAVVALSDIKGHLNILMPAQAVGALSRNLDTHSKNTFKPAYICAGFFVMHT